MKVNFSKTRRDLQSKSYFDNISSLNIEHSQNKTDDQ
jgi:hypothetical protein